MKSIARRSVSFLGLVAVGLAAAIALPAGTSCKIRGERRAYESIGADAASLRQAFNAAAGKVRLVVLVAPT
ncbi:MAG TPA: hypothetical protein VKB80_04870 [Kofleriaceae bacterium]|nr:hypothetical protein [Kofleriaceae bacterium]